MARSVTVEVRNEHGQRVVTATVTLAVDDPEPTEPGDKRTWPTAATFKVMHLPAMVPANHPALHPLIRKLESILK